MFLANFVAYTCALQSLGLARLPRGTTTQGGTSHARELPSCLSCLGGVDRRVVRRAGQRRCSAHKLPAAAGTSAAAIQSASTRIAQTSALSMQTSLAPSDPDGVRSTGVACRTRLPPEPSRWLLQHELATGCGLCHETVGLPGHANAGVTPIEFDNVNPTYSSLFTIYSPQRLFTAFDSKGLAVQFFVPRLDDAGNLERLRCCLH